MAIRENKIRAIHAERRLDEVRDALSDAGYRGRVWVKACDDAMGTVKVTKGQLLARVYVTCDGNDAGYVQLRPDMTLDYSHVGQSYRDEIEEVTQ